MPQDEPKPTSTPKASPAIPKLGRPGHHGGGWLKTGNTVNIGRKAGEIRSGMLRTIDDASSLMRSILDGSFRQEVRDARGNVVGHRPATIAEITRVFDALAKHALPTKTELSGPDGGAIPVQPCAPKLDALSVEEREALMGMLEKAEAGRTEADGAES